MLLLITGIAVLGNQESYVFDTYRSLEENKGSLKKCVKKSVTHTANNFDFDFSYHIYKLSFLNFLLGRQPNGPGKLRMNSKCNYIIQVSRWIEKGEFSFPLTDEGKEVKFEFAQVN